MFICLYDPPTVAGDLENTVLPKMLIFQGWSEHHGVVSCPDSAMLAVEPGRINLRLELNFIQQAPTRHTCGCDVGCDATEKK